VSFSDRDRSELRLELLRLRGETFICWKHWLDSDTGPRLSSLALETSNALLPPFGSHLVGGLWYEVSGCAIEKSGVDGECRYTQRAVIALN
jgi:hypothetical protein